ncbi:MAG: DUF4349 domain-containing protein [Polyangiaceae bacterium]
MDHEARRSEPSAAAPTAGAASSGVHRKALLEIHAELEIQLGETGDTTQMVGALESFAHEKGGFVASSTVGGKSADSGAHLVLRVPAADIGGVRALVAGKGSLMRESQTATDVTDSIADVDARVSAARLEEKRLLTLLEEKTGQLADVLAAEKVLGEVRERIERLEAEKRVAEGHVDLATVDVSIRPRESSGPAIGELVAAGRDGISAAKVVSLTMVSVALRGGPTTLLLGGVGWLIAAIVRILVKRSKSRLAWPV